MISVAGVQKPHYSPWCWLKAARRRAHYLVIIETFDGANRRSRSTKPQRWCYVSAVKELLGV
jgi:hypothetical protein